MNPPESFAEVFGVPFSLYRQVSTAARAASNDDWLRAAENGIPIKVARDLLKDIRLSTRGLTTLGGQAISRPNETEPAKISAGSAIRGTAGFMDLGITKLQDVKSLEMTIKAQVKNKTSEFATRYVNAFRDNNQHAMDTVIEEVNAWNDKQWDRGTPQFTINIGPSIDAKIRPVQPPKKMRGEFRKMEETWLK